MLNNNKGFTLLELLVALALLILVAGAMYSTYFSVVSAREKSGNKMEERRELSTTLGKLHSELASSFFKSSNNVNNKSSGTGSPGKLLFKVEDRDSFGKPTSTLFFSTIRPPSVSGAPASDVILVRYFVKEEKEGVLKLMREQRDPYWDTNYQSTPYPVMDSIDGFLVECYDGMKWVKSWDIAPTFNTGLPKVVRITLTLKGGEVLTTIARVRLTQS
ncbi:type II secretion system protein GspJ [Geomonas sp.]|uniref:type II secretion system protein GspJ n=1 Tax=Geomonas sp. TaxID=2651584 RepID=UPI002B4A6E6D|nr:type II secretion system protein GspJ [Geomonas sp.]HJV33925.1 type II secretion system protein GspJ [Geomonas sp.]